MEKLQESNAGYCRVSVNEIWTAKLVIMLCLQYEHIKEEIETLFQSEANWELINRKQAKLQNGSMKTSSVSGKTIIFTTMESYDMGVD